MSVAIEQLEYFDALYLEKCQVDTPIEIVEYVWSIVNKYREDVGKVLDLGAGDGKFSLRGKFDEYIGYEIDTSRSKSFAPRANARLEYSCAFSNLTSDYDLCIGNPPYVRHHDLNSEWQNRIAERISKELNVRLDRRSNAFVYFLCQAILRTKSDGLVVQLIPFEWVSRPASKFLRDYIRKNNWSVSVYRFEQDVFAHSKVLTTACITVIDKSNTDGRWDFYRINEDLECRKVESPTGYTTPVLKYKRRDRENYAQRGLSPGGQKVFCLTEQTRKKFNLEIGVDVVPCVTNLKAIDSNLKVLNKRSFTRNFVDRGEKCWLILPNKEPSLHLDAYLKSIEPSDRDNYTCRHQSPWWCYSQHPAPDILYGSGFTKFGPKVIVNSIGARALGSVHGVHQVNNIKKSELRDKLKEVNFERQIVSHSGALKKIEVNQMNYILNKLTLDCE